MKTVIVCLAFLAALLQNCAAGDPECLRHIQACLSPGRNQMTQHIDQYNFTAACSAMSQAYSCYDEAVRIEVCRAGNDVPGINALKQIDEHYQRTFCSNDSSTKTCEQGIERCSQQYQNALSQPTSDNCQAADTAIRCLNDLTCPQTFATIIAKFEQSLFNISLTNQCSSTNANISLCQKEIEVCVFPIQTKMNMALLMYNFTWLCSIQQDFDSCFTSSAATQPCNGDSVTIANNRRRLDTRYGQFCNSNHEPNGCLRDLQRCSTLYNDATSSPGFRTDVNFQCQAIETLTSCTNGVTQKQCTVNVTDLANGLAKERLLIAQSQQMDLNCANISLCQKEIDMCVFPILTNMNRALLMYNFTWFCSIQQGFDSCFTNSSKTPQCNGENVTIANNRRLFDARYEQYCNSDHEPAGCLRDLQNCSTVYNYASSSPRFQSDNSLQCQAIETLTSCTNGVTQEQCTVNVTDLANGLAKERLIIAQSQQMALYCGSRSNAGLSAIFLLAVIAISRWTMY